MYQYFRRWCHRGTLQKVLAQFGPELAPGWFFVDSTHVKVHADGSNPAGGQAPQAMGRTKGGLNTKIHVVVNARSQAIIVALSSGNEADICLAGKLTECLPENSTLIGDKAYDSSTLRRQRPLRELKPAFLVALTALRLYHSPQSSTGVVMGRNLLQRIKRYRRVATRYDEDLKLSWVLSALPSSSPLAHIDDLQTRPSILMAAWS